MLGDLKYIFDIVKFNERAKAYSETAIVCFPFKTNPNIEIVKALNFLNATGTLTTFEMDNIIPIQNLVTIHNVHPSRILFSNLSKDPADIYQAIRMGVRHFTIQDSETFTFIEQTMENISLNKLVKYLVRLNLGNFFHGLGIDFLRFGASLKIFHSIYNAARERKKEIGISFHAPQELESIVGSTHQNNVATIISTIQQYLAANNMHIDFLDIGGNTSLEELNSTEMQTSLRSFKQSQQNCQIIIESGSGIVQDCFDLESKIKTVNERIAPIGQLDDTGFPITVIHMAAGIYAGLLDNKLLGKEYEFLFNPEGEKEPILLEPLGKELKEGYKVVYLCGSSADIKDTMGYFQIPSGVNISPSDTIIIKNTGAYSEALFTRFTGQANPETVLLPNIGRDSLFR